MSPSHTNEGPVLAKPYIGITGIVHYCDITTAYECARIVRIDASTHRLMGGVLVSWKGPAGVAHTSRRYPNFEAVEGILARLNLAGAWPVVHYNTARAADVLAWELELLAERLPSMRGLQLNVVRPDPAVVAGFAEKHPKVEVILQVNNTSLGKGAEAITPRQYLARYSGIRHALLDGSGGTGRKIVPEAIAATLRDTREAAQKAGVRLAVAGGLGPGCDPEMMGLRDALAGSGIDLASLSYDAESGVRSPTPEAQAIPGEKHQDDLDRDKAVLYAYRMAESIGGGSYPFKCPECFGGEPDCDRCRGRGRV